MLAIDDDWSLILSTSLLGRWDSARHEELSLSDLESYPLLAACHRVWHASGDAGALPNRIDPLDLPREVLPTVMMLDLEADDESAQLRVRLAGTEVCAKHGGELKGKTTDDFFKPEDASAVVSSALAIARSRTPSLARRSYVSLNRRNWRYVRLIMPLSRNGERVDSFFKVADPGSMTELAR